MQSCQFPMKSTSVSEKGQPCLPSFLGHNENLESFVVFLDRDLVPYLNAIWSEKGIMNYVKFRK